MLQRRGFLALSCGAAAVLTAGCSTGGAATGGEQIDPAALPSFIPFEGVTPDGASTPEGVLAMFKQFPSERPSFAAEVPAGAGTVKILSQTDGAAAPPFSENRFWQSLNERIGVELDFNSVPAADLAAKQSVVIAGGDGPDLMQVKGRKSIPQMAQMLESQFADLTDFVAGDAVARYPGLANLPTKAWEATVFNGRIYGVPQASGNVGDILFVRQDLMDERGVSEHPTTEDEFFEVCAALTDPGKRNWALNSATTVFGFMLECLGVGRTWQLVDGRFVNAIETEQAIRAIELLAKLWGDGLVHPDAFSGNGALTEWFSNGMSAMNFGGLRFADIVQSATTNADLRVGLLPPFPIDGATPVKHLTNGTAGFTAVKKGSEDRIHELLSVINFLSPPFGTEEYLFRTYGEEGEHFKFIDGEPTLTEKGAADLRLPLAYVGRPPLVLYSPGRPESAQLQYDYQAAVIPTGVENVVENLTSETEERQGPALTRTIDDVRDQVIQGRATVDDWKSAVDDWRARGGDTIREEYAASAEQEA